MMRDITELLYWTKYMDIWAYLRWNIYEGYCIVLRHVHLLHITSFLYNCETIKSVLYFFIHITSLLYNSKTIKGVFYFLILIKNNLINVYTRPCFKSWFGRWRPPQPFFTSSDDRYLQGKYLIICSTCQFVKKLLL